MAEELVAKHVRGTVCDDAGTALPGAHVRATNDGTLVEATAGADGSYELELAPVPHALEITREGYCSVRIIIDVASLDWRPSFLLARECVVRGVAIDRETGARIPHALIVGVDGKGVTSRAECDDDGAFVLRGMRCGMASITGRAQRRISRTATRVELATDRDTENVEVVLDRAFAIVGRVVDRNDPPRGIEGARARITSLANQTPVTSDRDGRFEIDELPPGEYAVAATKPGMVIESQQVAIHDADVEIKLAIRPGATITGRVVPAAVATVELAPANPAVADHAHRGDLAQAKTTTDADGNFTILGVPRAGAIVLKATAADGRRGIVELSIDEQANEIVLEKVALLERRRVAGRVVGPEDEPIADAYIMPARRLRDVRLGRTSSDGSFELGNFDPGEYTLLVRGPTLRILGETVVDLNGGDRDDVCVKISTLGRISGRVVDEDDRPMAGWHVHIEGIRPLVTTDSDGGFEIKNVDEGAHTVAVYDARACRAKVNDVRSGAIVTIRVAPLGSVTVTVTRDGRPVKGVELGCATIAGKTDDAGMHVFSDLCPGDYECSAVTAELVAVGRVTVRSDHPTLHLELNEGATITGLVVDVLTGLPMADVRVEGIGGQACVTDRHGRFTVDHVASGSHALLLGLRGPFFRPFERPYRASPGERVELGTIELPPLRRGSLGTFGLMLEPRGRVLRVTRVVADQPAARAGIDVGDEVVAVAGRPTHELGLDVCEALLTSEFHIEIGQTLTVELSDGKIVTMIATRWL